MSRLTQLINGMPGGTERFICRQLDYHWGAENAISREQLLKNLHEHNGLSIDDRYMRRVIAYLREQGWPICSKGGENGGYWFDDDAGVKDFRKREDRRAKTILARDSKIERGLYTSPDRQTRFGD